MPELVFYPATLSVALGVSAILEREAGVPMATAVVLILSGVAVSAFLRWRPRGSDADIASQPVQRWLRRLLAETLRVFIGTLVLAMAALGLLTAARHFSGG